MLFASLGKECPVLFKTSSHPQGAVIRCVPMYANPLYRSEPVLRCPNHAATNKDRSPGGCMGAPPSHFVHSDHPSAQYVVGEGTRHHSVIVPYQPTGIDVNCCYLVIFSMLVQSVYISWKYWKSRGI